MNTLYIGYIGPIGFVLLCFSRTAIIYTFISEASSTEHNVHIPCVMYVVSITHDLIASSLKVFFLCQQQKISFSNFKETKSLYSLKENVCFSSYNVKVNNNILKFIIRIYNTYIDVVEL